jgi:hypothetical protein
MSSFVPQVEILSLEESDRIILHQGPEPTLLLKDGRGSGSKGAMVKEGGLGVKRPVMS